MNVKVLRDRKVVGVYDTRTKTIATKDSRWLKHATEGSSFSARAAAATDRRSTDQG